MEGSDAQWGAKTSKRETENWGPQEERKWAVEAQKGWGCVWGGGLGAGTRLLRQEHALLSCWLEWCSLIIMHYTIHLVWLSVFVDFPLKLKEFTGRHHLFEIRNQQYGYGLLHISRPGRTNTIKLALFLHLARKRPCGEGCGHCEFCYPRKGGSSPLSRCKA